MASSRDPGRSGVAGGRDRVAGWCWRWEEAREIGAEGVVELGRPRSSSPPDSNRRPRAGRPGLIAVALDQPEPLRIDKENARPAKRDRSLTRSRARLPNPVFRVFPRGTGEAGWLSPRGRTTTHSSGHSDRTRRSSRRRRHELTATQVGSAPVLCAPPSVQHGWTLHLSAKRTVPHARAIDKEQGARREDARAVEAPLSRRASEPVRIAHLVVERRSLPGRDGP
jgi:hypothetical protein